MEPKFEGSVIMRQAISDDELFATLKAMCECSNRLIVAKQEDFSTSNYEALAEKMADVKLWLDKIANQIEYTEDVEWWLSRKMNRHE
jgi:hypothetical protein